MLKLAGVIILNEKLEILLLHRNTPKRKQWEIPGGKIEKGETEEDAAIRETKEELNVDVKLLKKLGAKEFVEDDYTMSYTWFLAQITNGTPRVVEYDKFDEVRYWLPEKLKITDEPLSANTQNFLYFGIDYL